jgi:Tol biopolymer transport system component
MSVVRPLVLVLLAAACAAGATAAAAPVTPPIVFSADRAPSLSGEVYRLDADGKLVDLSNSPFGDTVPVVSPDGRSVAFRSYRGDSGVYVVGIDGSGLQRLTTPPLGTGNDTREVELAWAPDSRSLALTSGEGASAALSVVGPGRAPVVLAHATAFLPTWSPDGRLVTALVGGRIRAYRAAGGVAWTLRTSDTFFSSWSRRGRFLTILHNRVRVVDERGRPRLSFPGRAAVWSGDGTRIASIVGGRVEVRTGAGQVLQRKTVRGLAHQRTNIVWAGTRRVVFLVAEHPTALDLRTGRTTRISERYFRTRSPDGTSVIETAKRGSQFAVRVLHVDGTHAQTYGFVRGCYDDGGFIAAAQSLQFVPGRRSLVFESWCPEPPVDLYAVAADGSSLTKLTGDGKEYYGPSPSPDGTQLAYARADARGLSCKGCPASIWIAKADGGSPRLLVPGDDPTSESELSPSWSPDGGRILFVRTSPTIPPTLFVVPAAGGTPTSLHLSGIDASWGLTRIAWVDGATIPTSLWTASPDGTGKQKVAEGLVASPAWSHDGRLAYLDGAATAVVVSGASTTRVPLPFAQVNSLGWSPDGTRFVVAGFTKGAAVDDVYTARTDGTGLRRLTKNLEAYAASWR